MHQSLWRRSRVLLLVCCGWLPCAAAASAPDASADAPARIFAIGDVHGAYASLVGLLQALAGRIPARSWIC